MIDIKSIFSKYSNKQLNQKYIITVDIGNQNLCLLENFKIIEKYKISSSMYGEGNDEGSNKTPLGAHYIREFIGKDVDIYTIFKNRVSTNHIAKVLNKGEKSEEDIITTRILWLDGLEEGFNKGENFDTYKRYIYIHGTNEEDLIGQKASHGCIRMINSDIIKLCSKNLLNSFVYIST
tara:strand:+ start:225 stop:758 length:534 start_codon:yes stop_codon:yes gene_type:complete